MDVSSEVFGVHSSQRRDGLRMYPGLECVRGAALGDTSWQQWSPVEKERVLLLQHACVLWPF